MNEKTAPFLANKYFAEQSVFHPVNLLREARRKRTYPSGYLLSSVLKILDYNKLPRSRADEVLSENILLSKQSFGEYNPKIPRLRPGSVRLINFASQN